MEQLIIAVKDIIIIIIIKGLKQSIVNAELFQKNEIQETI